MYIKYNDIFFISKIVSFILYNLPNINSKNSNIQQLSLLKSYLNNNNNNFNLDITKIHSLKEKYENQILFLLNKRVKSIYTLNN